MIDVTTTVYCLRTPYFTWFHLWFRFHSPIELRNFHIFDVCKLINVNLKIFFNQLDSTLKFLIFWIESFCLGLVEPTTKKQLMGFLIQWSFINYVMQEVIGRLEEASVKHFLSWRVGGVRIFALRNLWTALLPHTDLAYCLPIPSVTVQLINNWKTVTDMPTFRTDEDWLAPEISGRSHCHQWKTPN